MVGTASSKLYPRPATIDVEAESKRRDAFVVILFRELKFDSNSLSHIMSSKSIEDRGKTIGSDSQHCMYG